MTLRKAAAIAVAAGLLLVAAGCAAVLARGGGSIFGNPLDGRETWLLCAFAFAALAGLVATWRGGPWAGSLCALLFSGGAAQLWLTDPDWFPSLRLQPSSALHVVMLAMAAIQGAVSLAAIAWLQRGAWRRFMAQFGHLKLAAAFLFSSAFCVAVMDYLDPFEPWRFLSNLSFGAVAAGAFLLNAVALAGAPDLPRTDFILENRHTPVLAALFAFAMSALLAYHAFGGASLVQDEAAYMFQAKTLAAGALAAPPPPDEVRDAFSHYLIAIDDARWRAVTAPGFSLALAPFAAMGAAQLLNPLLGALSVFLTYRLARRVFDEWGARLAAILAAASPWLLFSSASLMTHALSLALTLGAATLAFDTRPENEKRLLAGRSFGAGLLMGWLFVTRPLEGLLLGGALGFYLLFRFRRAAPTAVVAYGAGCVATGLAYFGFNAALTGDPLVSPQAQYLAQLWGNRGDAFGFGADIGPPAGLDKLDLAQGHSPIEGLVAMLNGLTALSSDLFGWTSASLLLLIAWIFWGRRERAPLVMAGVIALIVGAHFFYWLHDASYIGPRFWYGAFFPFIFLSVAGLDAVIRRAGEGAREPITTVALALACFGATIFVSWRAVEKYMPRSEDGRRIAAIARSEAYADALVITRDAQLAEDAMIFNDPFQRAGAPIFAFARDDAAEAALRRAYPDRRAIALERGD